MGILDRLVGRRAAPERKSVELPELLRRMAGSSGGTVTSTAQAAGIPAVFDAIRTISETGAMVPIHVYRDGEFVREKAPTSWQWGLFNKAPAVDMTAYDWRSDAYASLVGFGNFVALKVKGGNAGRFGPRVLALQPIDPRQCSAKWHNGRIVYTVNPGEGKSPLTLTRDEIFHVRGFTLHGEAWGLSPISACRAALSAGIGLEEYLSAFLRNDATPGGVLQFPGTVTQTEADDIVSVWNQSHGGADNSGKVGLLGGGAEWKAVGMSLKDAQFIEQHKFSVGQIARMFGMPTAMLADGTITPDDFKAFMTFGMGPWYTRMDAALNADPDLFPEADALFAESLADALLRPDSVTRFASYKDARQGSWITANEIRRLENLPPLEGGDELQVTPVGGAPNPKPAPGADPNNGANTDA